MKRYLAGQAKKLYKKLPDGVQKKIKNNLSTVIYANNTRGMLPNSDMMNWAKNNRRPVSIVIPSYNDYPLLKDCIESIRTTCADFDYEIIVVDDFCQPENTRLLKLLSGPRIKLIFKKKRQGFAITVNVGMKEAKHDIVMLNSDILAKDGWLEALQYSAYALDDSIGMVSPELIYPDGRIQYGGTYYARVLAPQWFGHLFVGRPAIDAVANVPFYNRSISGACVYIKHSVYKTLGGLDEKYWLGFEDVDYGLRAWDLGIRCFYQPASKLVHYESASRGYSQGMKELQSMRYFWGKWRSYFMARDKVGRSIDYIYSDESSDIWVEYINEQVKYLKDEVGIEVSVHHCNGERDENIIKAISDKNSVKICCDFGSVTTAWLGSMTKGRLVYLLPEIESGRFSGDPGKQSEIISKYRPEFDYISPSRYVENQLRIETAWESVTRLTPALRPAQFSSKSKNVSDEVLVISDNQTLVESVTSIALKHGRKCSSVKSSEVGLKLLKKISKKPPMLIVSTIKEQQSLLDLALISIAPLIALKNDKTQYEIMDGYNSLLADDESGIQHLVDDAMSNDYVIEELLKNGRETAKRYYDINKDTILDCINLCVKRSV